MARQSQKTAQAVAQKWSTNLSAAMPQMKAGASGVTTSPTQLAAANANGYLMGVQQNVQKWSRNLQAVTLQQWQNAYVTKGIPRVQTAATQSMPAVVQAMTTLLPAVYAARDQINSTMPRGTLAQNLARATAFATAMSTYGKS
jgi:hypothetical protein